MRKLTSGKVALSKLRKLANANPNRIVSCCRYVEDGCPMCIVGNILMNDYGVPADFFRRRDVNEHSSNNTANIRSLAPVLKELGYVDISNGALVVLREAQSVQDTNHPWSQAVERASKYV